MSEVKRIEPAIDWESREYWEAATRHELLIKRCGTCGRAHWYPRTHCPYCQADSTTWERSSGRGTVYTFTVIRQNSSSAFRDWVPYTVGLVELEEGPRVFALLRGDEETMCVGASVTVDFEEIGHRIFPVFVLEGA